MGVSHIGAGRGLGVVPQQVSAPKAEASATGLSKELLPETRKTLPEPAKGAANGHLVQKVFDRWDKDGDGVITRAEAGPRFGRGIMAELLKLQEAASATAPDAPEPAAPETTAPEPAADVPPLADPVADPLLEQIVLGEVTPPEAEVL